MVYLKLDKTPFPHS